jgi:hypothetical protein
MGCAKDASEQIIPLASLMAISFCQPGAHGKLVPSFLNE